MSETTFIEAMSRQVKAPARVKIFQTKQYPAEALRERLKHFLSHTSRMTEASYDRGDWTDNSDHTLVRLPKGARAVFYHASGAMKMVSGTPPMESIFKKDAGREEYIKMLEEKGKRFGLTEWVGEHATLQFERLWQIKACAANQEKKIVNPVVCRIVGAYRHMVDGLPVLGAASAVLKLGENGFVDAVSLQIREAAGEPIDEAPIIPPAEAAKQVSAQFRSLFGRQGGEALARVTSHDMQLGYFSLGKRKVQRVLAPFYVAFIHLKGKEENQAYQFAVPASETHYLSVCGQGSNPNNLLLQRK